MQSLLRLTCLFAAALCGAAFAHAQVSRDQETRDPGWRDYGADAAGTRYSAARQIDAANVSELAQAWTYHTGDKERQTPERYKRSSYEATPVLAEGRLYVCTPFNRVVALDAADGKEAWSFDAGIPDNFRPANDFVCRGVSLWDDAKAEAGAPCRRRLFFTTNDVRLIALDRDTGKLCEDFGKSGAVAIPPDRPPLFSGEFQITSAPTMAGDLVIVGAATDDMSRAAAPSAPVRALDARTGREVWTFDPVPRKADDPAAASWTGDSAKTNSGGGVWAPMSFDSARDLLFLPTAGPTGSYWGGGRPGDDLYTSSVVAVRASTGAVVWHFQTAHHDLWDYDVAAQPSLVDIDKDGRKIPAIVVATKTGFVFVLDRETGKPVFPVSERKVPASDMPGETISQTQPFPDVTPPLVRQNVGPDDSWGMLWFDRRACRASAAGARAEGLFTPPSAKGTFVAPFAGGGVNWGGGAIDSKRGLFIVNANDLAHIVTLIPRENYAAAKKEFPKVEIGRGLGTPYAVKRELWASPLGLPCVAPPWGILAAIDLRTGKLKWRVPLGRDPYSGLIKGSPGVGGPIATASGLTFIAASMDDKLRAYDSETGAELWSGKLPAGGQATPMTYVVGGRQYVVVMAGGHNRFGTTRGDSIVAYALPPAADADKPSGGLTY